MVASALQRLWTTYIVCRRVLTREHVIGKLVITLHTLLHPFFPPGISGSFISVSISMSSGALSVSVLVFLLHSSSRNPDYAGSTTKNQVRKRLDYQCSTDNP